jgi:phage terminase large subunit-like protein
MSSKEMSRAEQINALPPDERAKVLASFKPDELAALQWEWPFWARPSQLEPPGDWRNWLFLAGRGAGKTRCGAEWLRKNMTGSTPLTGGRWRHAAIIGETASDVRDVCVGDGKERSNPAAGSGLLQVCPKDFLPLYEPSKRRITFLNGASISTFNATEYEQLRGPEFEAAWCDETAKWQYQGPAWDMLAFCMRAGTDPRIFISTTPRPTALMKMLVADPATHVTRGSTLDNRANLAPAYIDTIMRRYGEHSRLGRQEIFGELIESVEGALFSQSNIDANRCSLRDLPPLERIVVAIDPAVSSNENSDECGIICAGISGDKFYVLDDASGVMSPLEWARTAVSLYHSRRADRIVAEKNNGGDLISSTIRQVDPNVPVTLVHASRGKATRAEPVAALAENNRISMCGTFRKLEDQLTSLTVDFNSREMGFSPDRADAMVYAIQALVDGAESSKPCFIGIDMSGGGYRGYEAQPPSWYGY